MKRAIDCKKTMRVNPPHQYNKVLYSGVEEALNDFTHLAAQICQTPIALITLNDTERRWLKSKLGLTIAAVSTESDLSSYGFRQDQVLIIEDTLTHERFATEPLLINDRQIRFYAGVPLIAPDNLVIGTLCVIDYLPHSISLEQIEALQALSCQIIKQLQLLKNLFYLAQTASENNWIEPQPDPQLFLKQNRFFSLSLDMLCIVDSDGYFKHINPAWEKTLGYTEKELLERSLLDFVHPEDKATTIAAIEQLTKGTSGLSFEHRYLCKNGLYKWLSWKAFSEIEAGLVYAIARDITDRRQTEELLVERSRKEEALRKSENRFRFLADMIPHQVWIAEPDGTLNYVNQRVLEYFSRSFEQIIGNGWQQMLHPDDMSNYHSRWQDCLLTGKPCEMEFRLLQSADETYRWHLGRALPLYDEQGKIVTWFGTSTDIDDRKQSEQKLRQQAALLDIATNAIFVHSLEQEILFWNKGAERLYGWKSEEIIGQNGCEFLFKESSPQLEEAINTIADTSEWHGEFQHVTKDGKKIIVESHWTLVCNDKQQPTSILVVNTDITEKKQLEAQFFRAQRMESIGTLAGGIAHDLNNLLAPILMAAQLLKTKLNDEQNQRLLTILETNAKRGGDLVKQVLSFARGIEGNRTILQVRHLIAEIQQIAKETFPKSIEFRTDIPRDLWTLSGDATQLHQVLMNLCVNARDAMDNGGMLNISAKNTFFDESYVQMNIEAHIGPYIEIIVADTGAGISTENIDKIFEPFFTTKELGKGTGLGLSTVIGIVKSHGGFVNVSSQIGKGTEFHIYLPAMKVAETQLSEEIELPVGEGELVLVVDDETAIRQVTKTSLETYGYKVITANDGIEAIALYVQHQREINIVLVDMMMPSMDGLTTIRTLQKINPEVKIISVSGLSPNDNLVLAADSDIKTFLMKPYTAKDLLRTIHAVLKG